MELSSVHLLLSGRLIHVHRNQQIFKEVLLYPDMDSVWCGASICRCLSSCRNIFFLIKKQRIIELLVSLWVLFIFSDNQNSFLLFASLIKPVIMLITGAAMLAKVIKIDAKNNFLISFIPFFIYCAIASMFSQVWDTSYQKLLSYFFLYLITSQLVSQIFKEKRTLEMFRDLVYVGVGILSFSLFAGVFIPGFGAYYGGRLNGVFRNPNGMGLFTSIFFMLASLIFGMTDVFKRRFKRYTYLVVIGCLLYTGSRTSMGAAFDFLFRFFNQFPLSMGICIFSNSPGVLLYGYI